MRAAANITRIMLVPLPPLGQVNELLSASGLPIVEAGHAPALQFFDYTAADELIGIAGIERLGKMALLRSCAVAPDYRGNGLGHALVAYAENQAAQQRIDALYLLTATATPFFAALGYQPVSRNDAPAPVRATTQFSAECPASATLMTKCIRQT